jgi:seryl-tRNA synthetase
MTAELLYTFTGHNTANAEIAYNVHLSEEEQGMELQDLATFGAMAVAAVTAYATIKTDMARLKERVIQLEKAEDENAQQLKNISAAIHRIEKALVKAGLIE